MNKDKTQDAITQNFNTVSLTEIANGTSGLGKYSALEIDGGDNIPDPIPEIRLDGNLIASRGNIIGISGHGKAGKSGVVNTLIAELIRRDTREIFDHHELLQIEANEDERAVIHFDTEQSKHKQNRNLKKIFHRAGWDERPPYFHSYNLRECSISEAQEAVSGVCEASAAQYGGIRAVIIDGIADLIADFNSLAESTLITKMISAIAIKYSCIVIVIIHTNPSNGAMSALKERGHLGTFIQNKCESLFRVRKDGNFTIVEPAFCREAAIDKVPIIRFMYDETKGYFIPFGVAERKQSKEERSAAPVNTDELLKRVFLPFSNYKYAEAWKKIKEVSIELGQKMGDTACKDLLGAWVDGDLVRKDEEKRLYYLNNAAA